MAAFIDNEAEVEATVPRQILDNEPSSTMANDGKKKASTYRARGWSFTANVPIGDEDRHINDPITEAIGDVRYMCWQYEREGHLHIQGYVYFGQPRSMKGAKEAIHAWCGIQAHMEVSRGSPAQNKHYCSKPVANCECKHCAPPNKPVPTRVAGPYEFGEVPAKGARTDLRECFMEFKANGYTEDLIDKYTTQMIMYGSKMELLVNKTRLGKWKQRTVFSPPEVRVLWGQTGTGKTRDAANDKAVFANFMSNMHWAHYEGEEVVCYDEFVGQIPMSQMLRELDGHPVTCRVMYLGNMPFIPKLIYVCSNNHPDTWWNFDRQPPSKEQRDALWRRFSCVIHLTNSALGVVRTLQKGVDYKETNFNAPAIVEEVDEGNRIRTETTVTGNPCLGCGKELCICPN